LDRGSEMRDLPSCPKFSKCSASICPIDALWELRTMRNSESVCFYLLEHAKTDSKARFEGRGLGNLHRRISAALPALLSRWGRLRRFYERARGSGSRLENSLPAATRNNRVQA
jgi:hypothetical protein